MKALPGEAKDEPTITQSIAALQAAGLPTAQIEHLVDLKWEIATGQRSESTHEHKRLMFAKHLYESGRVRG